MIETRRSSRDGANAELRRSARAQFRSVLDLDNPLVTEVMFGALSFAKRSNTVGKLELGSYGLILSVLTCGRSHRSAGRHESPLSWLVEWLDENGHDFARSVKGAASKIGKDVTELDLSDELREQTLAAAKRFAALTVPDGKSGVRQLILSLVNQPVFAQAFEPPLGRERVGELIDAFLAKVVVNAEYDDLLDGWEALRRSDTGEGLKPTTAEKAERLPTVSDHPANRDQLGRLAFAKVLAERLVDAERQARAEVGAPPLMAHIHGPWGSGKSSFLNLLRVELEGRDGTVRLSSPSSETPYPARLMP